MSNYLLSQCKFFELGQDLTCYYNSKNLNCIGALSFFTTRRGVLEKSFFLINFIGVIFKAGNETREKIWSGFCAEQN